MKHLLFPSHKPTGNNKPQNSSWTLKPASSYQHLCAPHRSSQRFSDVLWKCVLQVKPQAPGPAEKNQSQRQSRESRREARCLQWDQHAVGFLPEGDRDGQTLSEMSRPPKKKTLCPAWVQPAQNKEWTSMFGSRGVWTQTECVWFGERLCVIVSAGVKGDIVDFLCYCLSVCLAASPNVEQVSAH